MTVVSAAQGANILKNLGWRVDNAGRLGQAVKDFQQGWNLGPALAVDGSVGPATSAALLQSEANRRAGLGTASAHFSFSEFACKCGGQYVNCRCCWIFRAQIQRLESYRLHAGSVTIVSGNRCVDHNRAVGGASNSQHMFGTACDIAPQFSPNDVASWRLFAGLGFTGSTNRVCHADSRDLGGHNNGGTVHNPMRWRYKF